MSLHSRRQSSVAILVLLFLWAATNCAGRNRETIVLVTVEGVRASDIETTSPDASALRAFAQLASRGYKATCALTPSPDSAAAAASLMTGLPVKEHGVTDNVLGHLKPGVSLLAEELSRSGYETAAFIGTRSIDWRSGLARGFHRFDEAPAEGIATAESFSDRTGWDRSKKRRDPREVVRDALRWLGSEKRAGAFVWLHLGVLPEVPAVSMAEQSRETSQAKASKTLGGLVEIDEALALLIQGMEDLRIARRTVAVVGTSGYGRGEHGEWTSGLGLYDTTIRVPLLVSGDATPAQAVSSPVSTTVVTALLRRAAGMKGSGSASADGPAPSVGKGAAASAAEEAGREEAISVTFGPLVEFGWPPLAALRTKGWAYIDADPAELYDIYSDPGQSRNVAASEPERAGELSARLAAEHPYGSTGGHASGRPVAMESKQKVVALLLSATSEASGGNADRAEAKVRDALDLSPGNPAVFHVHSLVREAAGDHSGAKKALETLASTTQPSAYAAMVLARSLEEIGEGKQAAEVLKKSLETSERPRLRIALAETLVRNQAFEQAADVLHPLAQAEPSDPRLAEKLGDIYMAVGYGYRAASAYEKAMETGMRSPSILLKLGDCRLQLKDAQGALLLFQQAVKEDPASSAGQVKMGDALLALKKPNEAFAEYCKAIPATPQGFQRGMQIADALSAGEEDATALLLYQYLAQHDPKRFEPHFRIGLILLRNGRIPEAEGAFRYALSLDPQRAVIHYQLARIAIAKKDEAEALKQVKLLLQKGSPPLVQQVNADPAFKSLPENSEVRRILADALAKMVGGSAHDPFASSRPPEASGSGETPPPSGHGRASSP